MLSKHTHHPESPDQRGHARQLTLSLRNAIVLGIGLGILIPAILLGTMLASDSYQREFDVRVRSPLKQYAGMLEQTMPVPLWQVDATSAQSFVNSVMLNPDVVRIVVEDAALGRFVHAEQANVQKQGLLSETRDIRKDGAVIGRVTIEMSSHLMEQEFLKKFLKGGLAILVQLLISFFLLWLLFQRRMMRPLQQLQRDVDRLGQGQLADAVSVARADELGSLALGVDSMRLRLGELMHEQASHNATLEQRVEDRTRQLHASNQELRTALEDLNTAHAEIQRSDRLAALGSLVAGVAHELNTPIGNSVTVASTIHDLSREFNKEMEQGVTRAALQNYVDNNLAASDILLRNLHSAAELIGSFKRVAVDRTSAQRRVFLLDEVIREILLTIGAGIKRNVYEIRMDIPPEIRMDAYPGLLGQIISNLINNAILHGFEGRENGLIDVSARLLDTEPASVELSVRDNGIGIAGANLGRIFDPFFTTKLGQGGSGLGLNIVYNLVSDVLGGSIHVESQPEIGSSFIMQLPLCAPGHEDMGRRLL
ncbi:sensor histidine kinase [Undibacterium umbellatum]|uniref:histidine kinase n=1 Tax=Undibacterium umbellatum TaxID=2762300 RepID=A0ABR6ZHK5_9BURK|nr:ATP-binding protein [Undibacterium umbellatum]MBC3910712.1 HAMP domain-containing protein [Undibacterium umbellatum]